MFFITFSFITAHTHTFSAETILIGLIGMTILAKNFDAAGEHSKHWLPPLLQTNKPLRFVTHPPLLPKNIIE